MTNARADHDGAAEAPPLGRPRRSLASGGRIRVVVEPSPLGRLELPVRGALLRREAVAKVAGLPGAVARRELDAAERALGWEGHGRDRAAEAEADAALEEGRAARRRR